MLSEGSVNKQLMLIKICIEGISYWIGDSGASSHMVGDDEDLLQRLPFKERSMQPMEHQCPWFV